MPTVPYVKQTWTDGVSALSAARLAVLESGIYEVSLAPSVRVYHNANQSLTSGVATALAFNSERFDTCGNATDTQHDTVTNNSRLTCRYAGKYQITSGVRFGSNSTGYREVDIRLNGTTVIGASLHAAATGVVTIVTTTCLYDLAVNDYVETVATQTSGGALNAETSQASEFMMVRVA